jgi:serine/threonine protein kinase
MASSSSSVSPYPLSPALFSVLENESEEVLAQFQSLLSTNKKFKEKIDRLHSENYLGFVLQKKALKRPVWISHTGQCYPIFFDQLIASSKQGSKIWVCAVDLSKRKLRALSKISEIHEPSAHPKAWDEYQNLTEHQIGPKCFGFHSTEGLIYYHATDQIYPYPAVKKLSTSHFLQAKYDGDLSHFLEEQLIRNMGNRDKLESLANNLSAQMVFEVAKLNEKNLIHRDVKLENFLIKKSKDGSYKITLTDMEFLQRPGMTSSTPGSKESVSPQLVKEYYTLKSQSTASEHNDAWAAGITILKMRAFFGLSPAFHFVMNPELDKRFTLKTIYSLFRKPDWISAHEPTDPFEKMMWRLLRVEPSERWTARQAKAYIAPFAHSSLTV